MDGFCVVGKVIIAMTTDEALSFLQAHQPMPSDWNITDAEGEAFSRIIAYFEKRPDPRCIPLLIGAVSMETGLGMYEHIKFVLMAHEKSVVTAELRTALRSGNDCAKHRCCWWAVDIGAWELEDIIEPLVHHENEDIREAAENFLELKSELT